MGFSVLCGSPECPPGEPQHMQEFRALPVRESGCFHPLSCTPCDSFLLPTLPGDAAPAWSGSAAEGTLGSTPNTRVMAEPGWEDPCPAPWCELDRGGSGSLEGSVVWLPVTSEMNHLLKFKVKGWVCVPWPFECDPGPSLTGRGPLVLACPECPAGCLFQCSHGWAETGL